MRRYGMELNRAARSVIQEALDIREGETLVITADSISDAVVAESLAARFPVHRRGPSTFRVGQ